MANLISGVTGSFLGSIPFLLLWNWLMPIIFSLPRIDIFQAFGLLILSWMLFDWG